jgi:hypothetical protein
MRTLENQDILLFVMPHIPSESHFRALFHMIVYLMGTKVMSECSLRQDTTISREKHK